MSERFYVSSPLGAGDVVLEGAEARHLAAVCRLRPGDQVCLFNGDGRQYPACIKEVGKRTVTLEVLGVETPQRELPFRLEVAAPLPKGDRAQFLIEKLTELGVTRFVPLTTQRSVVQPRASTQEKLGRWVIEASKQCGRNVLLEIGPPAEWVGHCQRDDLPGTRLMAHICAQATGLDACGSVGDVVCAVGPEGGFTDAEIEVARAAGWRIVELGPRILRVETAAIAVSAALALGPRR